MDPAIHDASQTYVLEDDELPLLVFGYLSFMRPGKPIEVEGLRIPVPRKAGLLLEKLVTDRSGVKGDRDLLVVLGLMLVADASDIEELTDEYRRLPPELRHSVRWNLTVTVADRSDRRHAGSGLEPPEGDRASAPSRTGSS